MSRLLEPSLHLSFDVTRTKVVLRAHAGFEDDLAGLAARIAAGSQLSPLVAEIAIDDLLVGIDELTTWAADDVVWDEELASLVNGVLDDAETAKNNLQDSDARPPTLDSSALGLLLGPSWKAGLTTFQRRDISQLLALRHGANFSVPGAGKTRVALAIYAVLRERGELQRMLVIGPKSAHESWLYENSECFTEPLHASIMSTKAELGAELLIVNYERLARGLNGLASWLQSSPALIVLDEAHRMKLGAAGTYGAACLALGPLARRRLILTGTPAPNGAKDLESLMSFVWPGHGKRVVAEAVGDGDFADASRVLRPLFSRTTKQELGLPPLVSKIRYVDLPPLHREVYDALKGKPTARSGDLQALGKATLRVLMAAISPSLLLEGTDRYDPLEYRVPPIEASPGDSLHTLLKNLPQHELSPKYEETVRIVAENAALGRKTLVWTTFVRSLTTLERLLAPHHPAVVHGGTGDREEQLQRFREDPECLVLISNPATLGEGISLHQVCHDAVFVDRDFMAGRFLQSLDRIHRLGLDPSTETRVTVLAARGTIDEIVASRLDSKLKILSQILDDPSVREQGDLEEDVAGTGMNEADLRAALAHLSS